MRIGRGRKEGQDQDPQTCADCFSLSASSHGNGLSTFRKPWSRSSFRLPGHHWQLGLHDLLDQLRHANAGDRFDGDPKRLAPSVGGGPRDLGRWPRGHRQVAGERSTWGGAREPVKCAPTNHEISPRRASRSEASSRVSASSTSWS